MELFESLAIKIGEEKGKMVGAEGFEPSNDGIKIRKLTTCRRPNMTTLDAIQIGISIINDLN